jgi:hypothetical protein
LHRRCNRRRFKHIGAIEEIPDIFRLSEQQGTTRKMIDLYAKKIIKRSKMFERELLVELLNEGLK